MHRARLLVRCVSVETEPCGGEALVRCVAFGLLSDCIIPGTLVCGAGRVRNHVKESWFYDLRSQAFSSLHSFKNQRTPSTTPSYTTSLHTSQ